MAISALKKAETLSYILVSRDLLYYYSTHCEALLYNFMYKHTYTGIIIIINNNVTGFRVVIIGIRCMNVCVKILQLVLKRWDPFLDDLKFCMSF